ncbi:hypothetical protein NE237_018940 [Protea cynaroides]|uniref:Uncharacterized protein n=1 Tax=Protea cynaroides TaxID=273540 RepID=A0A9Q0KAU0_9MAGN|nr:hypothetical protein NE237_018940 [Protea cynaroides]
MPTETKLTALSSPFGCRFQRRRPSILPDVPAREPRSPLVSERVQLSLAVLQRGKAHGAVTESLSRLQRERRRYGVASAVDIETAKERSLKLWTETTLRNKEA